MISNHKKKMFKLILTFPITFHQKCSGGEDVSLEKIFWVTNAFHSLDRQSWQLKIYINRCSQSNLQLYDIKETALPPWQRSTLRRALMSWEEDWNWHQDLGSSIRLHRHLQYSSLLAFIYSYLVVCNLLVN